MTIDKREARRQKMKSELESIAVNLALLSPEGVATVEAICEQALISPRTFYNYFPSHDAAVIGDHWPRPSQEQIKYFSEGGTNDLFFDILTLCSAYSGENAEQELFNLRLKLIAKHPIWAEKAMGNFSIAMDEITDLVLTRLQQSASELESETDLRAQAQLTVRITGAILHDSLVEDPGDNEHLLELARKTMKSLL